MMVGVGAVTSESCQSGRMANEKHVRVEHLEDVPLEHVHMEIDFDWKHCNSVLSDAETGAITLPELRGQHGVYFIRSSIRGADEFESDACYVGRSIDDMEQRVIEAVRDAKKRFANNLDDNEGWVEVDIATNIRLDGSPVGDHAIDDPRLVEMIESAGTVWSLSYLNNQNKR